MSWWNNFFESATTILLAVVGLAFLAVLVSRNSQTAGVIQASASGFGNVLGVAESPVTGTATSINLGYPGGSGFTGNIVPFQMG